jgi:hypothetical protein
MALYVEHEMRIAGRMNEHFVNKPRWKRKHTEGERHEAYAENVVMAFTEVTEVDEIISESSTLASGSVDRIPQVTVAGFYFSCR